MNLNLSDKTALVCGSTQGIGWASAFELALMGANVTLMARNEASLQKKLAELPKNETQTHRYIVADFSHPDSVSAAIKSYLTEYPEVHILVNNSGGPAGGAIIDELPEKFVRIFEQHLVCNQILVQACVPSMISSGFGRIVNIISVSVKQPILGLGVSNTVRWAVASWSKTLSKEIARHGITVNNVLPGYTLTARLDQVNDMRAGNDGVSKAEVEKALTDTIPTKRFATAEEVAAAVAFLCSPAAASINGINVPVDGGLAASL